MRAMHLATLRPTTAEDDIQIAVQDLRRVISQRAANDSLDK